MADAASISVGDVPAGVPYYEELRGNLKELLKKRKRLEQELSACEDSIFQKETEYLENTPHGNVIAGFDNYVKGTTGAAAARRKSGLMEHNRVFSRSSISYNSNGDAQTPGSVTSNPVSHAPTPMSSSFKDSGSNHPTPTSATAPKSSGLTKASKKKAAAAAAANNEDSETDGKEPKKARTNFGVVKK